MTGRNRWINIVELALPLMLSACRLGFQKEPPSLLEAARPTLPSLEWTPAPSATPFPFKSIVRALIQNHTAPTLPSLPVDRATPVPTDVSTALSAASLTSVRHWPASTATLGEITGYLLGQTVNGIGTGRRWFTRFQFMACK